MPRIPAALAIAALTVALAAAAGPAAAVNFAALQAQANSPGGLTYEEARPRMPGLQRVTFEKADTNGDGVIDGQEWPALQGIYNATFRAR